MCDCKRCADCRYRKWLTSSAAYARFPIDPVIDWIEAWRERQRMTATYGERINQGLLSVERQLERDSGVCERSMYRITKRQSKFVRQTTAEKLALATGNDDEFYQIIDAQIGRDGWGPEGRKYCDDCGTWFHKHHEAGKCESCHNGKPLDMILA